MHAHATHRGGAFNLSFSFSAEPSRHIGLREFRGIVDISCGMTRNVSRYSNRNWVITVLPCEKDVHVMVAPSHHITDGAGNMFLGSNRLKVIFDD